MTTPCCIECGATIAAVSASVDPKTVDVVLQAQCAHVLDNVIGRDLWTNHGYRWSLPAVDGAALVTAERARQITREGYTPEHDAEHSDTLPWAAWSYLDRAIHPTDDPAPPAAWPWETEDWNANANALRRLIIAGALIVAEIDRRLVEQRSKP